MKNISIVLLSLLLLNCNEKQTKSVDATAIIDKAIKTAGVDELNSSILSFDFRDKHYVAARQNGKFELERQFKDASDDIRDVLSNRAFQRYVNDSLIIIPDSLATKYAASVNSVHYFSVLPYGLDRKAVNKTYLNKAEIKGKNYHRIGVTFNKDGGGEDFEDVFIYWINTETSQVDYLAYSYNEDDGIGLRFREAYNERFIKGIRFVDYNNFKPKERTTKLEDLDQLFMNNKLELLSKIELENLIVN